MIRAAAVLLLLAVSAAPSLSEGATWYVPSPEAPSIQAGIYAASPGDTVLVACGIYTTHRIVMKSGVVLRSETGQPECVVIDADSLGVIFHCVGVDAAARIEGFTMTRGSQGAVYCDASSLTFSNCVFEDNVATVYGGGAVYCFFASPVFVDCRFVGNRALYHGGAVYCYESTVQFTGCTFAENFSDQDGGGLRCLRSTADLITCTLAHNEAEDGGGVYANASDLLMSHCVVHSNSADGGGGGLFCYDTAPVIESCTFVDNGASYAGGMCFWQESDALINNTIIAFSHRGQSVICLDPGSTPVLTCCDVFGNALGDWVDCIAAQAGTNGNFSADPRFCSPWMHDYTISVDSPCAAALSPAGCGLVGALDVACDVTSAMESGVPPSGSLYLAPNRPNPFHPSTEITYGIPARTEPSHVTLAVYNALGQRIRTLVDREQSGGVHHVVWNGTDENAVPVASGVYFYRILWNGESETRRMVFLK